MNAVLLLGTLKSSELSHTQTLCEFLLGRMEREGIRGEIVKLVDRRIPPGTYSDMGGEDEWPEILRRILACDVVVLATPIWWDNASSLIQRVVERLDALHDEVLAGRASGLEGKIGGIVITGDSDGAQHVIGNLANFFNAIGLVLPPYGTLSVLWERQAKGADPKREELLAKYESDYTATADRMIRGWLEHAGRGPSGGSG